MFQSNRSKSTSTSHKPLLSDGVSSTRLIVILGTTFLFVVEETSRLEFDEGFAGEAEGFYRSTSEPIKKSKSVSIDILLDQQLEAKDA
jgi:hypothetical protein